MRPLEGRLRHRRDADQGYLGSHVLTSALRRSSRGLDRIKSTKQGELQGGKNVVFDAKVNGVASASGARRLLRRSRRRWRRSSKLLKAGKIKGSPPSSSRRRRSDASPTGAGRNGRPSSILEL